jgi:hypothetical protein
LDAVSTLQWKKWIDGRPEEKGDYILANKHGALVFTLRYRRSTDWPYSYRYTMSNGKMAYILCGEDWFSETALQECYWAKFELPKELTNG